MSRNAEKLNAVAAELDAISSEATCLAIPDDVRKYESCDAVVKQVVERFGKLDILVNGAAGNFLASAEKLSTNGFRTVMEIDTIGTFNMSKAAFTNAFKAARAGNIINISAALHWNGSALQAHSSAAKAGVDALTKVLAVEWGPYNVRVNGLVPGAIRGTEGFERLGNLSLMNSKEATKQAAATKASSSQMQGLELIPIPMQRMGEVQDIANCMLFLASAAGDYISGWNINVDGGSWLTIPNMLFAYPNFSQMWSQAKL
eukprot:Macronucleus_1987.p1 GENE.Macronucleus_1987~~Macronucleus_1987.p1  ORF type:complete len:259 (+),score=61.36 Macronucleus_1987:1-777(+)